MKRTWSGKPEDPNVFLHCICHLFVFNHSLITFGGRGTFSHTLPTPIPQLAWPEGSLFFLPGPHTSLQVFFASFSTACFDMRQEFCKGMSKCWRHQEPIRCFQTAWHSMLHRRLIGDCSTSIHQAQLLSRIEANDAAADAQRDVCACYGYCQIYSININNETLSAQTCLCALQKSISCFLCLFYCAHHSKFLALTMCG